MEINVECPKEMAQLVSDKIQECMTEAGKAFCHKLTMNSDSTISDHWIH